jgi:hypothetical protein
MPLFKSSFSTHNSLSTHKSTSSRPKSNNQRVNKVTRKTYEIIVVTQGSPSESLLMDMGMDPPPERGTSGLLPAPIRSFSRPPENPHDVDGDDLSIGSPIRFRSPAPPAAAAAPRPRCIFSRGTPPRPPLP